MARSFQLSHRLAVLFLSLTLVLLPSGSSVAQQPPATADAMPGGATATPPVDSGPRFVIYPKDGGDGDYFTLEAEPGSANELVVVLGNADDEPLFLSTYASNVLPITNGGFSLGSADAEPEGTTGWLDYESETFEFAPGEGIERTFTVTVPDDTEPGQYITGIALETAEPLAVEGTSLFEQTIRKTIAIFIIVPGPEEAVYTLGEPEVVTEGASSRIVIPLENTGNVLVRPEGELVVRNAAGDAVLTAPVAMGSVYAGFTVELTVAITTPLPEGEYTVSLDVSDEESGVAATLEEAAITVIPAEVLAAQVQVAGTVTLAPDAENPAFADVALTITNPGDPVATAEVVLEVSRDGTLVESFPLGPPFALPNGETSLAQRYIPPTGWEAGTWSFVVKVNALDASSSTSTTVATLDSLEPVSVGE